MQVSARGKEYVMRLFELTVGIRHNVEQIQRCYFLDYRHRPVEEIGQYLNAVYLSDKPQHFQ